MPLSMSVAIWLEGELGQLLLSNDTQRTSVTRDQWPVTRSDRESSKVLFALKWGSCRSARDAE